MKKMFLLGAMVCALGMMTACKSAKTISNSFQYTGEYKNGFAQIKKNGKWGCIDTAGNVIIAPIYDKLSYFFEELAYFKLNGKYGFIDNHGKIVIKAQYDEASFFGHGLAPVRKGKLWGYIDKNGEIVIPFKYDYAHSFFGGETAIVEKDGVFYEIDIYGNIVKVRNDLYRDTNRINEDDIIRCN